MNAGVAFPQTASPQTFPLNGAEFVETSKQTFPLSFRELRPRVYEFRPLVGFEFDGGTRRYGYEGHAGATDFYSPKVLSIGEIYKEVPQLWGLYSIGNCTISLDNNDKEFSILKATEPFKNRVGWVALCEPYYGEASIHRMFTGIIDYWTMQGGKFSPTLRDATIDRFQNTINQYAQTLNVTDFPNLPEYQLPKLVPIAFGLHTRITALFGGDDIAIGVLPAYLVDPAIGQTKYRYIAVQHETDNAQMEVFVYSILQTGGYTITNDTVGSRTVTYIDFDADPRDFGTHSPDEREVTFSVPFAHLTTGTIPANGPIPSIAPANAISTPLWELHTFLYLWDIMDVATEIDSTAWWDAISALTVNSTSFAVTREDETIKSMLAKHAETFLGWFYMTKDGLLAVTIPFQTGASTIAVSDSENIIASSFQVMSNRMTASRLQYNYAYNFVGDYFEKQPDMHDAGEETNLGADIRDNRNLWYLRMDDPTDNPPLIAAQAMESMTENTQLVRFSLPIRYHAGIEVTKIVTLTHFEGIDASGLGYDAVDVRILSVRFYPHPSESRIDVTGIVVP